MASLSSLLLIHSFCFSPLPFVLPSSSTSSSFPSTLPLSALFSLILFYCSDKMELEQNKMQIIRSLVWCFLVFSKFTCWPRSFSHLALRDDAGSTLTRGRPCQTWVPRWLSEKQSPCNAGSTRKWQRTPVFWRGKSHGQRSLVGYSLWGCKGVWHVV